MKPMYRRMLFVLAIAAMPAVAAAEDAFTLQQTDIYAGPSSDYPQIASLPPNTEVGVAGCLSDWSWCDVTFANDRGWVWAGDLGYPYQNGRVAIIEYGPRLRLPVVTFSINAYWDAHYRSRPFFREREVWVSRVHVEGGHGGKAPHGGTRVAQPSGGAQPGPAPRAQGGQAQPTPSAQGQAQVQGSQQQPRREQGAQSSDQHAGSRGMAQEQPSQREGRQAAQSASRPEAMHPEPDRGASAKGPQNEAARGQPDRGASAKGPQGERPKEEGREGNQQ
jgi:uncharacterized protein YraI